MSSEGENVSSIRELPNTEYYCNEALDEAFLIVYIVLGLAIFAGNTFCCIVFLANPKLRGCYMNIFLVSLGLADILGSILVIPGHCAFCTNCSKNFSLKQIVDEETCRFFDAVKDFVWLTSVLSLLGITYDRYLAVIQPLRYQCKMTPRKVSAVLGITWLLPIPFSFIKPIINDAGVDFLKKGSRSESIFDILVVLTLVILPMTIIFIVNFMVTKAIKNQLRKVHFERQESRGDQKPKDNRRKTISCLIVVVEKGLRLLEKISLVFIFLQSSANPFLYSFYRSDFRRGAKTLMRQVIPLGSKSSEHIDQPRKRFDTQESRVGPDLNEQPTELKLQEL
ncbi:hypothetical protein pdam_00004513 [Pocillopora damicornis]|uniref:G-protein coupled receptors family 1 profile domain-containing protein n=1 Tax=Pocillopora damicornis TaxID=46731 RepID=A0A3M6V289_POCDA|nr:hypothetical protein pdam_00004513 [Pocillopora damicornis]